MSNGGEQQPNMVWSLAWAGSSFFALLVVGVSWMFEPVTIPIIWVLILTFIPTRELQGILNDVADSARRQIAPEPRRRRPGEKGDDDKK